MLYPFENYVKVLLLKGYDNTSILKKTKAFGFVPLTDDEIDDRRNDLFGLLPPEVVQHIYPPDRANYQTLITKFSKELGLLNIDEVIPVLQGSRNKEWDEAINAVLDSEIRVPLQALILFKMPLEDIQSNMERKHGWAMSMAGLEMFIKYFWNIRAMTKLEVFNYISVIENGKIRSTFLDSYHRKEEKVRWKFTGENLLNYEKVLQSVMNESFQRFQSSLKDESTESVTVIGKWADLAMKAGEKFDKMFKKESTDSLNNLVFELKKKSQQDIATKEDVDGEIL
jgi:hypothetical protein